MLRATLCSILLLAGCSRSGPRDPLLAEVKTPLHAAVRAHDRNAEGSCRGVSGVERVSCWFGLGRTGCVYLELGEHPTTEVGDCALPTVGDRVLVDTSGERQVELEVDPAGERVAVRTAGRWSIFYLEQGFSLLRVAQTVPSPPVLDWSRVDPLERHLAELYANSSGERHQRIAERMRALGGEGPLIEYLSTVRPEDYEEWKPQFDSLSPEGQRQLRARLTGQLDLDGGLDSAPWVFLADHPELQPANFTDRVVAYLADVPARLESDGQVDWALEELLRKDRPEVGPLACRALEHDYATKTFAEAPEFEAAAPAIGSYTTLAILAETGTQCPWVGAWLETFPCAAPLGCLEPVDAGAPGDADDPTPTPGSQRCTEDQIREAMATWRAQLPRPQLPLLNPDGGEPDEVIPREVEVGPYFTAALEAQRGPRPAQFTQRDRAFYSLLDGKGRPALGPSCSALTESGWFQGALCKLPLEVRSVTVRACRARIDDASRRVTLTDLTPAE